MLKIAVFNFKGGTGKSTTDTVGESNQQEFQT